MFEPAVSMLRRKLVWQSAYLHEILILKTPPSILQLVYPSVIRRIISMLIQNLSPRTACFYNEWKEKYQGRSQTNLWTLEFSCRAVIWKCTCDAVGSNASCETCKPSSLTIERYLHRRGDGAILYDALRVIGENRKLS